jgi:hypothetical protein
VDDWTDVPAWPLGQADVRAVEAQLARRTGRRPERDLAVLGVLAAWPEPVTAGRLARFAGVEVPEARQVVRRWLPFLNESAGRRYALYHASSGTSSPTGST